MLRADSASVDILRRLKRAGRGLLASDIERYSFWGGGDLQRMLNFFHLRDYVTTHPAPRGKVEYRLTALGEEELSIIEAEGRGRWKAEEVTAMQLLNEGNELTSDVFTKALERRVGPTNGATLTVLEIAGFAKKDHLNRWSLTKPGQRTFENTPDWNDMPEEMKVPHGYRVHENGGGLVSLKAFVDEDTFVGPNARVEDEAVVQYSRLLGQSVVSGEAKVTGSVLEGEAVVSDNAVCEHTTVQDNACILQGSSVRASRVRGDVIITTRADIQSSEIQDSAYIEGVLRYAHVQDEVRVTPSGSLQGFVQTSPYQLIFKGKAEVAAPVHGVGTFSESVMSRPDAEKLKAKPASDEKTPPPGYHAHPNGGGWVADTAFVEETVVVEIGSWVRGEAQVLGISKVTSGGEVQGNAKVLDSTVVGGWVGGHALVSDSTVKFKSRVGGDSRVTEGSQIDGGLVLGGCLRNSDVRDRASVHGGTVQDSTLEGDAMVRDHSSVTKSTLQGHTVVEGYTTVISSIICGRNRLSGRTLVEKGSRLQGLSEGETTYLDVHIKPPRDLGQDAPAVDSETPPLEQNHLQPDGTRSFWDRAEEAQKEVDAWPEWKKKAADAALVTPLSQVVAKAAAHTVMKRVGEAVGVPKTVLNMATEVGRADVVSELVEKELKG